MSTKSFPINLAETTVEEKINFLYGAFLGFDTARKGRAYMSIGRKSLDADWFSTSVMPSKFGLNHRNFFNRRFFNLFKQDHGYFITALCTSNQIDNFVEALYRQIRFYKYQEEGTFALIASNNRRLDNSSIFAYLKDDQSEYIPVSTSSNDSDGAPADGAEILKEVDARIRKAVNAIRPVVVKIGERPDVVINERPHKSFKDVLDASIVERQAFLAGPAGTGKTTLAEQIAKALNLRFGFISCTAGMSEAHLLGRMDAHGNYLQSTFVDLYENGGLFLFDEVDAADANTMLTINSALANGMLSVPNRVQKPLAKRSEDFICLCAANTWGFGSNDYAGRNILDQAFLDRFVMSRFFVSYDEDLEREISADFPEVAVIVWAMRANAVNNKIRRVVSTRAIVSGVRMLKSGKTVRQFVDRFTTGWTEEEKKKLLNGVNY